ncbi:dsDNA nuclease domain-containing protein [Bacillus ndiopicus]|uniref:dsDNA nuclease domain-containing protein n=1 Tax=Bacillus ndiopicus TaxID=1347368 RepID=UPI0005A8859F|nr:dsDNA nuclease domain-containing protein [Bacillus ndiopicus]
MTSLFEKNNYQPRENSGSRSSNRLMIQISFAIHQMVQNTNDYLIILDIIDDVAIINNINQQEKITTYQIKTTDSNGYYELSRLIGDDVFKNIYEHIEKIEAEKIDKLYLICNYPIRYVLKRNKHEFIEGHLPLKNTVISQNIIDNINKNKAIAINDVPDSIYFNHWDIRLINHEEVIKAEFRTFLENVNSNLSLGVSSALYSSLRDILTKKQNYEFKLTENINDILPNKSFSKKNLFELIQRANTVVELNFREIEDKYLENVNLLEKRKYNVAFSSVKSHLYSFNNFVDDEIKSITEIIDNEYLDELSKMTTESQLFEFLQNKINSNPIFNKYEYKILLIMAIENYLHTS